MLRSAIQFVRAAPEHDNPIELLEGLQRVGQKHRHGLQIQCAWLLSELQDNPTLNSSIFFHPNFPGEQFLSERGAIVAREGASAVIDYARAQSGTFTLTEAMRALQLKGHDRWPLELIHRYGMRDVLSCQTHHWMAVFFSEDKVIQVDQFERQILSFAAGAAIDQLSRIVKKKQPPPDEFSELTPREIAALRHRAHGRNNHQGADQMGVSVNTFRTYLTRAMEKLGANDIAHCVALAMQLGLLQGAG